MSIKSHDRLERRVRVGGCIMLVAWLISFTLSVIITIAALGCIVFGAYFLATGDFLF